MMPITTVLVADFSMSNEPVTIDNTHGTVEAMDTPSSGRYRAKLDSLADVKREIAKCYRESRSGLLPVESLTKYTYVLDKLGNIISECDLEIRLEKMEDSIT